MRGLRRPVERSRTRGERERKRGRSRQIEKFFHTFISFHPVNLTAGLPLPGKT